MKSRRALGIFVALLAFVRVAFAHDPGLSVAEVEIRADTVALTTSFAPSDVQLLLPPGMRFSKPWTSAEFDSAKTLLLELGRSMWEVQAGGQTLRPAEPNVELTKNGDSVNFRLSFPRPTIGDPLLFRSLKLGLLPPTHREYFTAHDQQGLLVEKLLLAETPIVECPLVRADAVREGVEERAGVPSFAGFVKLGVEHIWTGYDHLLFLFGLLVVCRTFRSIVAIITCFTLAHSLTLALATLNVVNLPSRWVEPLIAASIVFVGVENLVRRGEEPKGRWALTFAFGLIHGFGFASVLRDLGVGQGGRGLLVPLFTFNLGVEVGQVAVAAVVLPIVWRLRKNEIFLRRGVPVLSAVVALAGLYWLLERTLFA
jgi:hydrogenase/urease accessory protein HupE